MDYYFCPATEKKTPQHSSCQITVCVASGCCGAAAAVALEWKTTSLDTALTTLHPTL